MKSTSFLELVPYIHSPSIAQVDGELISSFQIFINPLIECTNESLIYIFRNFTNFDVDYFDLLENFEELTKFNISTNKLVYIGQVYLKKFIKREIYRINFTVSIKNEENIDPSTSSLEYDKLLPNQVEEITEASQINEYTNIEEEIENDEINSDINQNEEIVNEIEEIVIINEINQNEEIGKLNVEKQINTTIYNKFVRENDRDTLSRNLGIDGELVMLDRLKELFPKFEVKLVSDISHSCDIHMISDIHKFIFAFEIKNKLSVTNEDVSKFENDLRYLSNHFNEYRIIGIFISLHSNIPKYGKFFIDTSLCYLSKEFTSDSCIQLIVKSYLTVHSSKVESPRQKIQYEIPRNVFTLLSELKFQYSLNNSNIEIYRKQIEINKQSTSSMYELIARTEVQRNLINFINKEFEEIDNPDTSQNKQIADEQKLKEYLRNKTRKSIKKSELKELFPFISSLTLVQIWERYGNNDS